MYCKKRPFRKYMAEVFLAHDKVLDRDVALKVLRSQYVRDEEFAERISERPAAPRASRTRTSSRSTIGARPRTAHATSPWSTCPAAPSRSGSGRRAR
jgi:hypothetical protein